MDSKVSHAGTGIAWVVVVVVVEVVVESGMCPSAEWGDCAWGEVKRLGAQCMDAAQCTLSMTMSTRLHGPDMDLTEEMMPVQEEMSELVRGRQCSCCVRI